MLTLFCQLPFANKAIKFKDWPMVKSTFPLGQLPLLEVKQDNRSTYSIVQSNAILCYLGKLSGLYPKDMVESAKVDLLLDTLVEASVPIKMSVQGAIKKMTADKEWSKDEVLLI
jgi:glutathione S-transferase